MFGLGSYFEKLVDKGSKPDNTKEWGDGWGDDDLDIDESDSSQESPSKPIQTN